MCRLQGKWSNWENGKEIFFIQRLCINLWRKSLQTKVFAADLERYISFVEKNSFIIDIYSLRVNQHNHFHYGGHLIDVEISIEKMKEFLEQNKETFDILAEKNFERMKFLRQTNLVK